MTEPADGPRQSRDRRTFGPVVVTGLGSGALAAIAAARPWAEVEGASDVATAAAARPGLGESPLASTLSLVVLAAWGALLVTRGRVRRSLAVLAAVAALGLLAATAVAGRSLPGDLRAEVAPGGSEAVAGLTPWFWVALAGAVAVTVASILAVLWVPAWPTMGSRYDAPAGPDESPSRAAATPAELWKAIDEGRDPTT